MMENALARIFGQKIEVLRVSDDGAGIEFKIENYPHVTGIARQISEDKMEYQFGNMAGIVELKAE